MSEFHGAQFVIKGLPVSKKNTWGLGGARGTKLGVRIVQRSKGVKEYQESTRIQFMFAAKRIGFEKIAAPRKVALRIKIYFLTKQNRMDVHNAVETLLDALQGYAYDNDNQVVGVWTPPVRYVDDKNPRIEIEVQDALVAERDPRWADV